MLCRVPFLSSRETWFNGYECDPDRAYARCDEVTIDGLKQRGRQPATKDCNAGSLSKGVQGTLLISRSFTHPRK